VGNFGKVGVGTPDSGVGVGYFTSDSSTLVVNKQFDTKSFNIHISVCYVLALLYSC